MTERLLVWLLYENISLPKPGSVGRPAYFYVIYFYTIYGLAEILAKQQTATFFAEIIREKTKKISLW
jgi:hypothetical protein